MLGGFWKTSSYKLKSNPYRWLFKPSVFWVCSGL